MSSNWEAVFLFALSSCFTKRIVETKSAMSTPLYDYCYCWFYCCCCYYYCIPVGYLLLTSVSFGVFADSSSFLATIFSCFGGTLWVIPPFIGSVSIDCWSSQLFPEFTLAFANDSCYYYYSVVCSFIFSYLSLLLLFFF